MAAQIEELKEKLVEAVMNRIGELSNDGFVVPEGYNVRNEIIQAYYILSQPRKGKYGDADDADSKKPIMEVCSRDSVVQSLFVMVSDGLSAIRKQGYFIPYGKTCTWQVSYFGNEAIGKRIANVNRVDPFTVHKDDKFAHRVDKGRIVEIVHEQELENMDKPITAAYCYVTFNDGTIDIDLMTIAQIRKSWNMANAKGDKNKLQTEFSVEAAKRTVSNRALKPIVNAAVQVVAKSDDPDQTEDPMTFDDHEVVTDQKALTPKVVSLPPAMSKITVPVEKPKEPVMAETPKTEPLVSAQESDDFD